MSKHELQIETIARGVVFHGEHVLVCRDRKGGYCYLPGGHIEFGETSGEALAREFDEETGVAVRVGECVLVHEHLFRQKGRVRHEINVVFRVELDGVMPPTGRRPVPPAVESREKEIAFEWVSADKLAAEDFRPTGLASTVVGLRDGPCRWRSDRSA